MKITGSYEKYPERFLQYLRMSVEAFDVLLRKIERKIEKTEAMLACMAASICCLRFEFLFVALSSTIFRSRQIVDDNVVGDMRHSVHRKAIIETMSLSRKRRIALLLEDDLLPSSFSHSKKRQYGVHPVNRYRQEYGEFHHLYRQLRKYPERFFQYLRMSVETFDVLLKKMKRKIEKHTTNFGETNFF
ncbi:hypothetical protein NQ317_007925 [Molorchus minor]|uniref:Uncharacterized protein n=1 Tax=Molorchus minor TaxID=1323400 RepID=A0ABQ9IPP9_9CUCU|nr:hypothetical protein NQ317_007925 [Molorchus minor]